MNRKVDYGLTQFINGHKNVVDTDCIGRIIKQTNHTFTIATQRGFIEQVKQKRTKKEKKKETTKKTYITGDFVEIEKVEEHYFLKKYFERINIVSKTESHAKKSFHNKLIEQLIAANVDHVFITIAADQRFTLSKLERYILTFTIPNAELTILITKADYSEQAHYLMKQIEASDFNEEVIPISIHDEKSIQKVSKQLTKGSTSIILGASGAGKSTLINKLIGIENEKIGAVRDDGKGKHTTTYSTLIYLPENQAYMIDTPGVKSISTTKKMNDSLFEDIIELSRYCKFRDCKHDTEPKCRVKQAVKNGELSNERLKRYRKYVT